MHCVSNDTVMVLLQATCPKKLSQGDLTQPDTVKQAVMLRTVSLVVCLVYGICKIFRNSKQNLASIARTKQQQQ